MKSLSRFVNVGSRDATAWSARVVLKAAADAAGRLITFAVMVAAARVLDPAAFGVLAIAATAGWLLGVATDAGWGMHLAREVARRREAWPVTARDVLQRRAVAALVALVVALVAAPFVAPGHAGAFCCLVAWQLLTAVLETAMHVVRGLERTEYEALIQTGVRIATGAVAAAALVWRPELIALGVALLVPPAGGLAALALVFRKLATSIPASARPARSTIEFRRQVLPLGLGALVSALYFRCDVFFVEHWHGLEAAGAYGAVFRLVDASRLLPAAVLAVSFPRLVRTTDVSAVVRLGAALMGLGSIAAGAIAAAAAPLVALTYGERYAAAAPVLVLLACAVPFFYANAALTHQLIGWDGQRAYLWIACAALVVNLVANAGLVPPYGAAGAAAATGLTELVVTAGCLVALRAPRAAAAAAVLEGPLA